PNCNLPHPESFQSRPCTMSCQAERTISDCNLRSFAPLRMTVAFCEACRLLLRAYPSGRGADAFFRWLLRFSFRVHTAACVVGFRFRRARREVGEHFVVSAPRAGGAIEFRQGGVVSEERLQPRRLRGEQLHLG